MPSQTDIGTHKKLVDDVINLAMRDLVGLWRTFTLDNVDQARKEISTVLPLIIDGYGTPMASLSADWYDQLRDEAELRVAYRAKALDPMPSQARLDSLTKWSTRSLYGTQVDENMALKALAGGVQRILGNIDRDSIINNAVKDPTTVRYARHAASDACAFCAMLATRGAVYVSKSAAETVVGRGTEKRHDGTRQDSLRKGIRPRGKQALGEGFHDYCRCTNVAVFSGQDYEPPAYNKKFEDAYLEAPAPADGGALDLKETLASMRKTLDTK